MHLTHRRAQRQFDHFGPLYDQARGVLFPIVQGGVHKDLRQESVAFLSPLATDGIAVGGVSVGEPKEQIQEMMEFIGPQLPADKPRYIMGIGEPSDILKAIESGFDMFDCVLPSRLGRHGTALTSQGLIKITNATFKSDFSPLDPASACFTSTRFTKAYLHHLFHENEMLGATLLTLNNISYLHGLVQQKRQEILLCHPEPLNTI